MGMFDKLFGKKKEEEKVQSEVKREPQIYNLREIPMREADLKYDRKAYEYYDPHPEFGKFYDTTRLVVDGKPLIVDGEELHRCMVSYFNESDAIMIDDNGKEIGSRTFYKEVYAGINPELIGRDPEYTKCLITKLLDKKRVDEFLDRSLMTEEEIREEAERTNNSRLIPCGKYIGGIARNREGNYVKQFSTNVGEIMHNTAEMEYERDNIRMRQRIKRQEEMQAKREEMERLQAELKQYEDEEGEGR